MQIIYKLNFHLFCKKVMKHMLPPSSVVGTMVTSPIAAPCFVIFITVCVEFTY